MIAAAAGPERAIATLLKLLPDDRRECEQALELVRRVFAGPPPELGRDKGAACVFLASHYASAITGDTIYIDGGCHIFG